MQDREASPSNGNRPLRLSILLSLLVVFLLSLTSMADAQSGRRAPRPISPVPTPEPSTPTTAKSTTSGKSDTKALYSFILYEGENVSMNLPMRAADAVMRGFMERMRQSQSVTIKDAGRGSRARARDEAKKQTETFVVALELDDNQMSSRTPGTIDTSNIAVRYAVYTPQTGTLKLSGSVYLRPLTRTTRGVGGLPIPIPVPSGGVSYEYVLEQAGRDAADRVFSGLSIRLPER